MDHESMPGRTLRSRRVVAAGETGIVLMLLSVGLLIARSEAEQRRVQTTRFDTRQATAARFIEAYVAGVFERETRLAGRVYSGDRADEQFAAAAQDQGFDAAVLLDAEGRLLAAEPSNPAIVGKNIAAKYAHLRSAVSGVPAVSGVVPSATRGVPIIGFAVPFETPSGRRVFSGAYAVADTPLAPFVRTAAPFRSAHVLIVDAAGLVVSGSDPGDAGRPLTDVNAELARVASTTGRRDGTGEVYIRQTPIGGTTWRLIFAVDTDELFGPIRTTARWIPWAGLTAFGAVALLALAFFHRYQRQRAHLVDSEARQRTILDTAGDGFVGMDDRGVITEWNAAAARLLGWNAGEAIGRPLVDLVIPPEHRIAHLAGVSRYLNTGQTSLPNRPIKVQAMRRDGDRVDVEFTLSRMRWGAGWQFHAFLRDISRQLQQETQLRELALTDGLTGLANRRAAVDRLEQALARAQRHGKPVAALFIDVDKFKSVNDHYGHAAGDRVLVDIAARLRAIFRLEDTLARLGGDEFLIVCEDLDTPEDSRVLAARTRAALAEPYDIAGQQVYVTASVGLGLSAPNTTVERLLAHADAEMYDAKATRQAFTAIVDSESSRP